MTPTYEEACNNLDIQTLEARRTSLCLSFAIKCTESEKFKHMFRENDANQYEKFQVPFAKTSRYKNSPKVYLTRLSNDHHAKQTKPLEA